MAACTVKLIGTNEQVVYQEAKKLLEDKAEYNSMSEACNPYGDGKASQRIVQAILYRYGLSSEKPDSFVAKYY